MSIALPPMQSLYCFYLAANAGSFKQAAEQLNVTAAAMSQQIRLLESRLDQKLFVREHRKVLLTPAGETLFSYAKDAFRLLTEGVSELKGDQHPNRLSVSVLPSFAQNWLVARLGSFPSEKFDFKVYLSTGDELTDFAAEDVDLGIRFGLGEYPGLESHFLMEDRLYPVAHNGFLQQHGLCAQTPIEDIVEHRLIEDTRPDMSWERWLKQSGSDCTPHAASFLFKGAHVALEAVLSGQGIALARHSLAWRYIRQGLLTKIGNAEVKSPYSYFLVGPPGNFHYEKVKVFKRWLLAEAREFWQESQQHLGSDRRVFEPNLNISC